jgi:hypothetical protein
MSEGMGRPPVGHRPKSAATTGIPFMLRSGTLFGSVKTPKKVIFIDGPSSKVRRAAPYHLGPNRGGESGAIDEER